jgi:hypothetical protein
VKFAAVAGHRYGRATPSLRDAPQRQSMEGIGQESIYRNRNAVQTRPAISLSYRRSTRMGTNLVLLIHINALSCRFRYRGASPTYQTRAVL